MDCVAEYNRFPSHVRTDCGTENVLVAAIQSYVSGSESAHVYGTSPGNQRIEAWWSFFRRHRAQWWIELFERMVTNGSFTPGNIRQTDCLRYCFIPFVQADLDVVRHQWNTHRIRPSEGARCPAGIPDELFFLPHPPAVDCSRSTHLYLPCSLLNQLQHPRPCDDADMKTYLDYVCSVRNLGRPTDAVSAEQLYCTLVHYCN